VRPAQVSF
jgi:hypothetical protein